MKKALRITIFLLFIGFVGLQFMRPDRTNPPVNESETLQASAEIPKDINAIFERSCNDCHSNNTVFPWYSNIAPISWKVGQHIEEGREELNFSIWNTYSKDKRLRKLEEICEEVDSRAMPHEQYLYIHWDAELSEEDIKTLCDWTENLSVEIAKKE